MQLIAIVVTEQHGRQRIRCESIEDVCRQLGRYGLIGEETKEKLRTGQLVENAKFSAVVARVVPQAEVRRQGELFD